MGVMRRRFNDERQIEVQAKFNRTTV